MSLKDVLNEGNAVFDAYPELEKINDGNWRITWMNEDCTIEVTSEYGGGLLFRELHPQAGDIITEFENLTLDQLMDVFRAYED